MHPHDPFGDDRFDNDPFDHEPFGHDRSLHDPFARGWSSGRRHVRRPGGPIGIAVSVVMGLVALVVFSAIASDMGSGPPMGPGLGDPAGDLYDDPCVVRPGESDDAALDRCVEDYERQFQEDGFGF